MASVLIVDDVAVNREVLAQLLAHRGHRVLQASNGADALAIVEQSALDLVITDGLMPVMDGFELIRRLRLDDRTRALPVVLYTAHYAEHEARVLADAGNVSAILEKPVEPVEAMRLFDRLLAEDAHDNMPPSGPLPPEFDRDHLRIVTDKLSATENDLRRANARLRALVNIGLELASQRDTERLLHKVCAVSGELIGVSYVTLGVVDRHDHRVHRLVVHGTEATSWVENGKAAPGMLATVVQDREVIAGVNAGGNPESLGLPRSHPPIESYMVAPVTSPTHVYGWFCLVRNEGEPFEDDDGQLLVALAGLLGRIYENGYFYAIARRRAEDLEQEVLVRRDAEAALRHERDRSQLYLDTAQVMLIAVDRSNHIRLANAYACSVLGWTRDELTGQPFSMIVPERLRSRSESRLESARGGDLPVTESAVVTKSGEERIVAWRNSVMRDRDGNAIGTLSSGADITEQHRATQALKTAEERMRFALESADVGIWDMDFVNNTLQWSETLERQYGLAPGTFDGTYESYMDIVHPDDRQSLVDRIAAARQAGGDFQTDHRVVWPDGTVRRVHGTGRILHDDRGVAVRGIGITMDVTEQSVLEAQYQQAQKMEAVGRFAGGVAHDFNNLLTAILGYCELMLSDMPPDAPHRKDVLGIQKVGTSAAALTRQLLTFSRKQITDIRELDLNLLVKDIERFLTRMIGEDINIVLDLAPELRPIMADQAQIEQVVMNLAVNARDAMPNGGRLTIATANVDLVDDRATSLRVKPGRYVRLTVSDTGVGMSEEVRSRLFEPFFTTKDPGKGTGLGLATVDGIIDRTGGAIAVDSEIGSGSSFSIYLPQFEGVSAAKPLVKDAAARGAGGGETVLAVEDDVSVRELVSILLQRAGYRVLIASNAAEATRLFADNEHIDVLLTDVVMPGASGPDLTLRLMSQRPTLRVIYMSGYTEDAIAQHDLFRPGVSFLPKPFTSETLNRKIREVLDAQS